MADPDPAPGIPPDFQLLGAHYRLTRKLGEGAFGEVYEARHELLQQDFAVKLLRPELCEDENSRDRFLDEARALIRFSHPNVVQLRHVGSQAGRLYLVMDLVRGRPLSEVIARDGPLGEARALALMQQLLGGLEAAHAAGIIHRDLKPSNLVVERRVDGEEMLRILDFGLSKLHGIDGMQSAHRSITGTIIGTLAYMSPEQLKGERDVDARSDVFAAGLVLQEMLQGHHPYPGESGIVVAAKLLRDPVPALDEAVTGDLTPACLSALATALERDRDARFPSATTFAEALKGKGPPSDTSRVTTIADAQRELARQEAAGRTAGAGAPSRRGLRIAAVVLLLGALAGGAYALGLLGRDDPQPATEVARTEPPAPTADADTETDTDTDTDTDATPAGTPPAAATETERNPDTAPAPPEAQPVAPPAAEPAPTPQPEPEPEPEGASEPEPEAAPQPAPDPVPATVPTPEACCEEARAASQAGNWAEAERLYRLALADPKSGTAVHVAALRGSAESAIAAADQLARRGDVPAALARLEALIAFLDERLEAYGGQAVDAARLEIGFAYTHLGEAHTEMARWLEVAGRAAEAQAHLRPAGDAFEFALPNLDRDGERYHEFLLRRAELHRLRGRGRAPLRAYIDDLAATTKVQNGEVLPRAWVAHATGYRRVAEAAWSRSALDQARALAARGVTTAKRGVSWQADAFTRADWLALVRVLFVAGALTPPEEDPLALAGLARYWIEQAALRPAPAWEDERLAAARLQTGQAVAAYLDGRAALHRRKGKVGRQHLTRALTLVTEAIATRQAVAAAGGRLPAGLPFQVKAALLHALDRGDEAQAARREAAAAEARNPD